MKYSYWLKGKTIGMTDEEKSGYCLGSADAWQYQQNRIDGLQAGIDAALKIADELEQSLEMYKTGIELKKILKGGEK